MDGHSPATVSLSKAPSALCMVAQVHAACLVLLCLSATAFCAAEMSVKADVCVALPKVLMDNCACSVTAVNDVLLVCKGLNSTEGFRLNPEETHELKANGIGGSGDPLQPKRSILRHSLRHITLRAGHLHQLNLEDFTALSNLIELTVVNCETKKVVTADLPSLRSLDLSVNALEHLNHDLLPALPDLRHLNLSSNLLTSLPEETFAFTQRLISVDLSSNRLSEALKQSSLSSLPSGLRYLDISSEYYWLFGDMIHFDQAKNRVILGLLKKRFCLKSEKKKSRTS